ncbi:MAG: alpha/beta fold hydrolase [Thermoguttaceae bacterium]|jgi:pimeloyl-ACP methyl ester carboxylesterase
MITTRITPDVQLDELLTFAWQMNRGRPMDGRKMGQKGLLARSLSKQTSIKGLRAAILLTILLLFCVSAVNRLAAEENQPAKKTAPAGKAAAEELPKPEDVTLQTADSVQLVATYYRGGKGKESIPIVLLHGWKHNRTDYTKDFAPFLQSKGFAVVVPDLRGHGDSTRLKTLYGKDETLDAVTLAPKQFNLMVYQDLKAVKEFLWEKNNAGELNLDKLCVVGAEMGASIALEFAWYDAMGYDQGSPEYGSLKLGRFVKALVLISPETSFKGIDIRHAVQNPAVRNDISVLILLGNGDNKALSEAKRVYSIFERDHPKPDPEKKADQQTLFFTPLETKLQGANLLTEKNLKTEEIINAFLNLRLVKSDAAKSWLWKERKLPHQ